MKVPKKIKSLDQSLWQRWMVSYLEFIAFQGWCSGLPAIFHTATTAEGQNNMGKVLNFFLSKNIVWLAACSFFSKSKTSWSLREQIFNLVKVTEVFWKLFMIAWAIPCGVIFWGSSISTADRRRQDRLVRRASSISGCPPWPSGGGGREPIDSTGQALQSKTDSPQESEGQVSQAAPACSHQTVTSSAPSWPRAPKILGLHHTST